MRLLDTTSEVAKLAGKIANPELVQGAMKANTEALALSKENLDLQKKVVELESKLRESQRQRDIVNRVFRNGNYVFVDNDPDGHCPVCWDASRKLIHLLQQRYKGLHCPECQTQFNGMTARNPGRDDEYSIPVW